MERNVKAAWVRVTLLGGTALGMAVGMAAPALAQGYDMGGRGGMMGRDYMMGGSLWHGIGALLWLIIVGLIIAGIVLLIRRLWDVGGRAQDGGARALLDARYARGEIDDDEYQRRKKTLMG